MSRALRIALLCTLAVTAWCMTAGGVEARVASDEPADPAAETDYQVVRLLSKLFTSIKRSYVEILSLQKRLSRSADRHEHGEIRAVLEERIGQVEGKGREYSSLVPSLVSSYPALKSVIHSFSKDLSAILEDLNRIKHAERLNVEPAIAGADPSAGGASPAIGGAGSAGAAATGADPMILPITLEIRNAGGEKVPQRRVKFVVERGRSRGIRGILDGRSLVAEKVAVTDRTGKASVRLQLEDARAPLRIKRTIVPMDDQTVCRLETVPGTGPDLPATTRE
jgi:hypothetical protein